MISFDQKFEDKCAIGLDLGQTALKAGIVDTQGSLIASDEIESNFLIHPELLPIEISSLIDKLLELSASKGLQIAGIGLSSTIDVDSRSGRFRFIHIDDLKEWEGFSIRDFLHSRTNLPVVVENDGVAAAWGEFSVGAGRGFRNMISITVGTGLGGGIILDGQRLPDSLGSAAYFGHMTINFEGPVCDRCGQRGCWELYASSTALVKRAGSAILNQGIASSLTGAPTGRDIVNAAKAGDPLALELLAEIGWYLGVGISNLVNIFNPEIVILGGGLVHAGDLLLDPVKTSMDTQRMKLRENIELRSAQLGAYSGVIGAALLV